MGRKRVYVNMNNGKETSVETHISGIRAGGGCASLAGGGDGLGKIFSHEGADTVSGAGGEGIPTVCNGTCN